METSEDAIGVGRQVWEGVDRGYDLVEVLKVAVRSGLTRDQGSYVIWAAVNAYCPQYEYMLN
ncbi:DUF732 domain-containing protein [Rhodococcus sp. 14-2470-1a]|uniref:DUF732 domain-containing protein n=1 Tax=Rhodococcus sp. 14-2470-1a TaxID=2023150 RepID=UPI0035946FF1